MFPPSNTDLIALQQAVTLSLSQSDSPDEALERALHALGEALQWPIGTAWRVDAAGDSLVCQQIWLDPATPMPAFAAICRETRFRFGEGLPGRVWQDRAPVCLPDVPVDPRFPRSEVAAAVGLQTVIGIPILCGTDLLGVLEFWRRGATLPTDEQLAVLELLGIQLGSFLRLADSERILRHQTATFKAWLAASLDSFIAIDHLGVITEFNPAAEQTFGYHRDDVIGRSMTEVIVPPAMRVPHAEGMARLLATGESRVLGKRIEITAMRRDGSEFPVELTITRPDLPGSPQFVAALRDLSQQKSVEHDLRQAVSARDAFLSIASHELKTPLTSLQLHVESLRRHPDLYPLEAPALAKVAHIEQAVQRLNHLINDLLDVSRLAVGRLAIEPEPTDLGAVARDVVQRFEEQSRRAGSTVTVAADAEVVGFWDRSRVDQVVTNLLSNAIKFGSGQPIDLAIRRQGPTVILTVQDQGIGIAPEHQDRLFQRFERLVSARHFGGFGLGLWIVRQFIEAMGGTIDVDSAPGRGTTFRVRLPVGDPAAVAPSPFTRLQPPPAGS